MPRPGTWPRLAEVALSGVAAAPLDDEVIALARRLGPPALRTPDALHLATAVLLDVDVFIAYERRLLDAARESGLLVEAPGSEAPGTSLP